MILPLGPVPETEARLMLLAFAILCAIGLAKILSPDLDAGAAGCYFAGAALTGAAATGAAATGSCFATSGAAASA